MNNAHPNHLVWRLLLSIGIALAFISCGTSTVGNPGSSAVVRFGINGQDTSGALFTYWYDSAANHWNVAIGPSTTPYAPDKLVGDTVVSRCDTGVFAADGPENTR